MLPLILDCASLRLSAEEKAFFRAANPFGFILFERNCESPAQIRALIAELHEATGRNVLPVLIDQEGGRVARLKPPHWSRFPAAWRFAERYAAAPERAVRAARLNARLIAEELRTIGVTVNCAPVADLPVPGAHDIIGDRAYGTTVTQVVALARAVADGHMEGGVVPVVKHIPGHGRARADSHAELPAVNTPHEELSRTDFAVFHALRDIPMAMTAHVLYTAIDPTHMATTSPRVMQVMREEIGFDGLLMSDALSMSAMQGSWEERTQAALGAGCDVVLACNGFRYETTVPVMEQIAAACPPFTAKGLARAEASMQAARTTPAAWDIAAARAEVEGFLSATIAA